MEILIKKEYSAIAKDANEIGWKLIKKKSLSSFYLLLLLGSVLLITGSISKYELNFWNFRTSFGIGFLLMAGFTLLKIFELKSTFFSSHKKIENSYNLFEFKIDEIGINCNSANTSSLTKWEYFKFYKVQYGFILFYPDNSEFYTCVINEDDINEIERMELKDFLNQKLKFKL